MKDTKKFSPSVKRPTLPWSSLEQQVVRMQKQITHASQRNDRQAVHMLQQRLIESEAARLLAVRRVAEENHGKHTAGVDGVKSLDAKERLVMASLIHPDNWHGQTPLPVRRVWIPKPGTTEQRPLAILPMIDRCKQALVKLALEPEWEVRFEEHSYGFRPGRGVHDAITAILVAIEHHPGFVFEADIEGAFDHVHQAAVLEKLQTYPALRRLIQAWLTAGVMDGNSYAPSYTGIAQGGVLSPLLMNIALHGIESVVMDSSSSSHSGYPGKQGKQNQQGQQTPLLVRYADNFVMLHTDIKTLQQAIQRVQQWLAALGLNLHPDKTHLSHTLTPYQGQVGFDFLGFSIRQESSLNMSMGKPASNRQSSYGMQPEKRSSTAIRTHIAPSQDAEKRHLASIEQRLRQAQTLPQAQVIRQLNPLITGWVAYYNGIVPATIMSRYDTLLEHRLLHWAEKRHPGQSREWLLNRYWHSTGKQKRVFATSEGLQLRAYQQARILKEERP